MTDASCDYCERTPAEADVRRDAFTGAPVCTDCAQLARIPTGELTVSVVEEVIRDAVTEDAPGYEEREIQAMAITRLAQLIVAQNQRIAELEKKLADRPTEQ